MRYGAGRGDITRFTDASPPTSPRRSGAQVPEGTIMRTGEEGEFNPHNRYSHTPQARVAAGFTMVRAAGHDANILSGPGQPLDSQNEVPVGTTLDPSRQYLIAPTPSQQTVTIPTMGEHGGMPLQQGATRYVAPGGSGSAFIATDNNASGSAFIATDNNASGSAFIATDNNASGSAIANTGQGTTSNLPITVPDGYMVVRHPGGPLGTSVPVGLSEAQAMGGVDVEPVYPQIPFVTGPITRDMVATVDEKAVTQQASALELFSEIELAYAQQRGEHAERYARAASIPVVSLTGLPQLFTYGRNKLERHRSKKGLDAGRIRLQSTQKAHRKIAVESARAEFHEATLPRRSAAAVRAAAAEAGYDEDDLLWSRISGGRIGLQQAIDEEQYERDKKLQKDDRAVQDKQRENDGWLLATQGKLLQEAGDASDARTKAAAIFNRTSEAELEKLKSENKDRDGLLTKRSIENQTGQLEFDNKKVSAQTHERKEQFEREKLEQETADLRRKEARKQMKHERRVKQYLKAGDSVPDSVPDSDSDSDFDFDSDNESGVKAKKKRRAVSPAKLEKKVNGMLQRLTKAQRDEKHFIMVPLDAIRPHLTKVVKENPDLEVLPAFLCAAKEFSQDKSLGQNNAWIKKQSQNAVKWINSIFGTETMAKPDIIEHIARQFTSIRIPKFLNDPNPQPKARDIFDGFMMATDLYAKACMQNWNEAQLIQNMQAYVPVQKSLAPVDIMNGLQLLQQQTLRQQYAQQQQQQYARSQQQFAPQQQAAPQQAAQQQQQQQPPYMQQAAQQQQQTAQQGLQQQPPYMQQTAQHAPKQQFQQQYQEMQQRAAGGLNDAPLGRSQSTGRGSLRRQGTASTAPLSESSSVRSLVGAGLSDRSLQGYSSDASTAPLSGRSLVGAGSSNGSLVSAGSFRRSQSVQPRRREPVAAAAPETSEPRLLSRFKMSPQDRAAINAARLMNPHQEPSWYRNYIQASKHYSEDLENLGISKNDFCAQFAEAKKDVKLQSKDDTFITQYISLKFQDVEKEEAEYMTETLQNMTIVFNKNENKGDSVDFAKGFKAFMLTIYDEDPDQIYDNDALRKTFNFAAYFANGSVNAKHIFSKSPEKQFTFAKTFAEQMMNVPEGEEIDEEDAINFSMHFTNAMKKAEKKYPDDLRMQDDVIDGYLNRHYYSSDSDSDEG